MATDPSGHDRETPLGAPIQQALRVALDDAIRRAEAHSPGGVTALDAGCGHRSPLRRYRARLARLVGADVHEPAVPMPYLDAFVIVDLCGPADGFDGASFDIVLSNFTFEHLVDPPAALANIRRWLRPEGTLVATTVNRRHPFVAAYLGIPAGLRSRLQPMIKSSAADAHPLVGACNDAAVIRADLATAGFERVTLQSVSNLAHAWRHHRLGRIAGTVGDLLTRSLPARRSTFVIIARAPA